MLALGAVAYDPKVITIWEGFCAWFGRRDLDVSYVLYWTYEEQVDALLRGEGGVAWSSPLAWLQSERRARAASESTIGFAMRDTDLDLTSLILVANDGPVGSVGDLNGRRIAVGAYDSPQATLIPLLL